MCPIILPLNRISLSKNLVIGISPGQSVQSCTQHTASTEGAVNASQLVAEKERFSLCCFEREFVAPGSAGAQRVRYGGDARRTKNLRMEITSKARQARCEIWYVLIALHSLWVKGQNYDFSFPFSGHQVFRDGFWKKMTY